MNPDVDYRWVIRCSKCKWQELTTGISVDITHLKEIKKGCPTCGGARKFHCPKCGQVAKMLKLRK